MGKRGREDEVEAAPSTSDPDPYSDSDDDAPALKKKQPIRSAAECPYMDSICRQKLDFDFEKCCSVSLKRNNVYACLVCGKYFQGRARHTNAFTHALDTSHHMFMNLADARVYCLPDNYEIKDQSLVDIQYLLNPTYEATEVTKLDADVKWAKALDGSDYMPGLMGLNNLKDSDYANAVIQILARVPAVRNFFLCTKNYATCKSPLVQRLGELMRKLWSSRAFKGQVSPHEFMQAVMRESKKRFTAESRSDPHDFLVWLLNSLHLALSGGKRKRSTVITKCFQGELEVTVLAGTGKAKDSKEDVVEKAPFFVLGLDLPPAPLYQDAMEKNAIPQVPIFNILTKYDATSVHDDIKMGRRRYRVTKLPRHLVLHLRRFRKNNFFVEKNPTIVNFPVKGLDLTQVIPVPKTQEKPAPAKYDLIANLCHDGKVGEGTHRLHVHRKAEDSWYEVQDLRIVDVLPQMVALSEAYLQVYELREGGDSAVTTTAGQA